MIIKISLLKVIANRFCSVFTQAYSTKTNHYSALGISPKSTQNEIKTAYYKLSMMYHPDKNKDDDASLQKFRKITEAYEVLGNVSTRKMYDKGLFIGNTVVKGDTMHNIYKSKKSQTGPPSTSSHTSTVYDFDEWAKSHYGATFQRQMENRRRKQQYQHDRQTSVSNNKLEQIVFFLLVVVLICTGVLGEKNYDNVNYDRLTMKKPTRD